MNTGDYVLNTILLFVFVCLGGSCSDPGYPKIRDVSVSFPGNNVSNAEVRINTAEAISTSLKYWVKGREEKKFVLPASEPNKNHRFLLTNLEPGKQYVVTVSTGEDTLAENYFFKTIDYATSTKDSFQVMCTDANVLPAIFRDGYVMIHRREVPGLLLLLDTKGNIVWYHQLWNMGFKVVRFTKNQTFLCLVGTPEFKTGYGSAILELSLAGDTLLYLKKGKNDFNQTLHHDITLNHNDEIVTLFMDERIIDLRTKGGLEKDTVRGDGILVLDRQGRQKWKWTVFDELDPLRDEKILQTKKDWMHANSISFDKDGNYLISFYNNGQIWKIDAVSGKLIWRFGKNGNIEIPAPAMFDQAHAVHITYNGWLMLFDNGSSGKRSRSLAFKLDKTQKKAQPVVDAWLPSYLFTERMGSSYVVGDSTLLVCASMQKTVALTNFTGKFLWQLRSNRLIPYRAEFIPKEKIDLDRAN